MDEKAVQAIAECFGQAEPQTTSGIFTGTVLLTPPSVERHPKKPSFLTPRFEFVFPLSSGTTELWSYTWRPSHHGAKTVAVGIYQGGFDFPKFCCACIKPATQYEVIELGGPIEGSVRFQSTNLTTKRADLVADAWAKKRYWYAIPFCSAHSLSSKAVALETWQDDKIRIGFKNQEYGRLFGELNNLGGEGLDQSAMLARNVAPWLALAGVLTAFIGGLFVYRGFVGRLGVTTSGPMDLPLGFATLLAGFGLAAWGAAFWFQHGRVRKRD
ncbi:MAG: hypothetical protein ACE5JF_10100 [Anaerolineales bacterium]